MTIPTGATISGIYRVSRWGYWTKQLQVIRSQSDCRKILWRICEYKPRRRSSFNAPPLLLFDLIRACMKPRNQMSTIVKKTKSEKGKVNCDEQKKRISLDLFYEANNANPSPIVIHSQSPWSNESTKQKQRFLFRVGYVAAFPPST